MNGMNLPSYSKLHMLWAARVQAILRDINKLLRPIYPKPKRAEKFMNMKVDHQKLTVEFPANGVAFDCYRTAVDALKAVGYSIGSTQAMAPTGFKKGDCSIAKWRNLNDSDRAELDGQIIELGFRTGPVVVQFKDPAKFTEFVESISKPA